MAEQIVETKVLRSMYVPLDLWVKLREEAAKRGTSVNQIVVEALRFYLEARPFFSDRRVLEALRALASEGGTSGELERFAKALSEVLTKEKKVKSGG